jgi:hypothetical protein
MVEAQADEIQVVRKILTAGEIIAELQDGIADVSDGAKDRVVAHAFDAKKRDIPIWKLSAMRVADLLLPKSGIWQSGSKETEQMEAARTLLGDSVRLLDLTPAAISRELSDSERPWDGSYIDIRGDHSYTLRLLTTLRNGITGKRLYYTLAVESAGKGSINVRQRLHSCNISQIDLEAPRPSRPNLRAL